MESIRVDASMLADMASKSVRIIGVLESIKESENSVFLESNGSIKLTVNSSLDNLIIGNWYEIIGIVQKDMSVTVLQMFNFGDNLNKESVAKMVQLVHKLPELYQSV